MTQLLADLLPAAMLGLFIALPIGPICLMCRPTILSSAR